MNTMHISVITSALPGMCLLPKEFVLSAQYPDLGEEDLSLIEAFESAYEKKDKQPERYQQIGSLMIKRLGDLRIEFECSNSESQHQLDVLAKLINFNTFLREVGVSPNDYVHSNSKQEKIFPQIHLGEGIDGSVMREVKRLLDIKGKELAFLPYVNNHVDHVFLISSINDSFASSPKGSLATCEQTTRSAIVEAQDKAWQIARAIVHEAAHIERFYLLKDGPKTQKYERAERYAYIVELLYLRVLYNKLVEEKQGPEITGPIELEFKAVYDKISALNKKLKIPENDIFNINKY